MQYAIGRVDVNILSNLLRIARSCANAPRSSDSSFNIKSVLDRIKAYVLTGVEYPSPVSVFFNEVRNELYRYLEFCWGVHTKGGHFYQFMEVLSCMLMSKYGMDNLPNAVSKHVSIVLLTCSSGESEVYKSIYCSLQPLIDDANNIKLTFVQVQDYVRHRVACLGNICNEPSSARSSSTDSVQASLVLLDLCEANFSAVPGVVDGVHEELYPRHLSMSALIQCLEITSSAYLYKKGIIRMNRRKVGIDDTGKHQFQWVGIVSTGSDSASGGAVYVEGDVACNRALDGDEVVVKVDSSGPKLYEGDGSAHMATGVVVGVWNRNSLGDVIAKVPPFPGDFEDIGRDRRERNVLVKPLNHQLPLVKLTTRSWKQLGGRYILVHISGWGIRDGFPSGYLVRSLDMGLTALSTFSSPVHRKLLTAIDCLGYKYELDLEPFSIQALGNLPCVPASKDRRGPSPLPSSEVNPQSLMSVPTMEPLGVQHQSSSKRMDITEQRTVFSIDPKGCQDIDDAMSVHWVENARCTSVHNSDCSTTIQTRVVEIGVHIADVTSFLDKGSALDLAAQTRGTTVYLPQQRIDMLPSLLAADLASLHSNVDRRAVSIFMTYELELRCAPVDADWSTLNYIELYERGDLLISPILNGVRNQDNVTWVGRTLIHNCASMTYEQADELLSLDSLSEYDDQSDANTVTGEAGKPVPIEHRARLSHDIRLLTVLSRELAKRRGGINLGRLEGGGQLKFETNSSESYMEVTSYESHMHMEMHDTVAELMILANSQVARKLYEHAPSDSLLRIHPPPSAEKLNVLKLYLVDMGLMEAIAHCVSTYSDSFLQSPGKNDNSGSVLSDAGLKYFMRHHKAILAYVKKTYADGIGIVVSSQVIEFITSLITQCMSEAQYICSQQVTGCAVSGEGNVVNMLAVTGDNLEGSVYLGHVGLELLHYTHFTSPIRRYADVIVHRLLLRYVAETAPCLPIKGGNQASAASGGAAGSDANADGLDELLAGISGDMINGVSDATGSCAKVGSDANADGLDELLAGISGDMINGVSDVTGSCAEVGSDANSDGLDELLAGMSGDMINGVSDATGSCAKVGSLSLASPRNSLGSASVVDVEADEIASTPVYSRQVLTRIASHLNSKNRNAKLFAREVEKLYIRLFLCTHPDREYRGIIYSNSFKIPSENSSVNTNHITVPEYNSPAYEYMVFVTQLDTYVAMQSSCKLAVPQEVSVTIGVETTGCRQRSQGWDAEDYLDLLQGKLVGTRVLEDCCSSANMQPIDIYSIGVGSTNTNSEFRNVESELPPHAKIVRKQKHEKFKLPPILAGNVRCQVKHSTRIAFGSMPTKSDTVDEESSSTDSSGVLPLKYLLHPHFKMELSKTAQDTGINGIDAGHPQSRSEYMSCLESSTAQSHAFAKQQMEKYGEIWAEEEDLPDSACQIEVGDSVGNETSIYGVSHKEMASAMSRQNKLRIAKKNSKY